MCASRSLQICNHKTGVPSVLSEKIQANVEACLHLPPQPAKKPGGGNEHEVNLHIAASDSPHVGCQLPCCISKHVVVSAPVPAKCSHSPAVDSWNANDKGQCSLHDVTWHAMTYCSHGLTTSFVCIGSCQCGCAFVAQLPCHCCQAAPCLVLIHNVHQDST